MSNEEKKLKENLYISYFVCGVLLVGLLFYNQIPWQWLRTGLAVGFIFTLIDALCDQWKLFRLKKALTKNNETE